MDSESFEDELATGDFWVKMKRMQRSDKEDILQDDDMETRQDCYISNEEGRRSWQDRGLNISRIKDTDVFVISVLEDIDFIGERGEDVKVEEREINNIDEIESYIETELEKLEEVEQDQVMMPMEVEQDQEMMPVNEEVSGRRRRDYDEEVKIGEKTYKILAVQPIKVFEVIDGVIRVFVKNKGCWDIDRGRAEEKTIEELWGGDKEPNRYVWKAPESNVYVISVCSFEVRDGEEILQRVNSLPKEYNFRPARSKEELAEFLGMEYEEAPQAMMEEELRDMDREIERQYVFEIDNVPEDSSLIELVTYFTNWSIPTRYALLAEGVEVKPEEGKLKVYVSLKNNAEGAPKEFLADFIKEFMEGRNSVDFYEAWNEYVKNEIDDEFTKGILSKLTAEECERYLGAIEIRYIGEETE